MLLIVGLLLARFASRVRSYIVGESELRRQSNSVGS